MPVNFIVTSMSIAKKYTAILYSLEVPVNYEDKMCLFKSLSKLTTLFSILILMSSFPNSKIL